MFRWFLILVLSLLPPVLLLKGATEPAPTPRLLEKANVLPLALDGAFSFQKQTILLHDPVFRRAGRLDMMEFERGRVSYKAVTGEEVRSRFGQYFAFWWRARREADLTVRLEYRQENLGPYVLAQEIPVPRAKGTVETKFQVTGDDYNRDGKVLAWRALLIEDGKIVALRQSYLWF